MKKSVVYLLAVVLCSVLASAAFDVDVLPIRDTIPSDGVAQFRVTIKNTGEEQQKFRVFNDFVEWDIYTVPRSDSSFTIQPDKSKTVFVEANPLSSTIREGFYYQVPLTINSITNDHIKTATLPIGVQSQEFIESIYSPRIDTKVSVDREVDPREPMEINVEIMNRNPRNFSKITVQLSSDLVNQQQELALGPYKTQNVAFTAKFDDLQSPVKDVLNVHITYNNSQGNPIIVAKQENLFYEVVGYGSITDKVERVKSFLKRTKIITLTNDANQINTDLYKVPAPFFRIFQSANPAPTLLREEGETYYAWELSMDPQDTFEIQVVTNVRIIFYLFIIAILCILLYYFLRSPLVITKTASNVIMREGGVTEMKILISLKNRSYRVIEDVHVTDRVPQVADIKKEFEVGTLQPSRIVKHEHRGTVVKWNLDGLESFEERILSYTIASKMSILGDFRLPTTSATFKQYNRRRKGKSNRYMLKNIG